MSSSNPYPMPSFHLSGGLPVVARSRPGPEILAARLMIRGGSSADPAGQRGAHQLLAGTMTRGCGHLDADALADLVEGAGAALRADAHEDSLVLGLKCAATDSTDLLPLLLAMGLLFSLLSFSFAPRLAGIGGDLGATAAVSVFAVLGARVLVRDRR